ncbi:hypothetical protein F4780DRAFT_791651 [Xylariomycetidae sp. FL0641]|nr:hypothetical protein F4780DRAFT_791651 [Xylariomycetidae sp. FL0641]
MAVDLLASVGMRTIYNDINPHSACSAVVTRSSNDIHMAFTHAPSGCKCVGGPGPEGMSWLRALLYQTCLAIDPHEEAEMVFCIFLKNALGFALPGPLTVRKPSREHVRIMRNPATKLWENTVDLLKIQRPQYFDDSLDLD